MAYGEDGADYFYVDHTDSGQALFYGGAGDDVFQAGWLTEFHAVGGDLTFFGEVGDDRAEVYQLNATGSLTFEGGAGNDALDLRRP